MNKTFKFQLKPTVEQVLQLRQFCDARRFIWNWMLDVNIQSYELGGVFIWKFPVSKQLPQIKEYNPWLKEVPAHLLLEAAFDLDKALPRSKHKVKKGFPHFARKGKKESFRITQNNNHIKIDPYINEVKIPKIGWIKCKMHRQVVGDIKTINIKQVRNKWFASICVELPDVPLQPAIDVNVIGIDLGMQTFATLSDGTKIHKPNHLSEKQRRLKRYQRRYSRKQKGSNNQKKARARLSRAHERITNQRADFLHQESRKIVDMYDGVCMEDLKTKDLMMCNKTLGRTASNRKIADLSWSMFIGMIKYKAAFSGKLFAQVSQWAPSSQVCSSCGHRHGSMPLDVRSWTCTECGSHHDRDINAAMNIRAWGMQLMPQDLIYQVPQELGEFTPAEIMSSTSTSVVDATRIAEAGSYVLKDVAVH